MGRTSKIGNFSFRNFKFAGMKLLMVQCNYKKKKFGKCNTFGVKGQKPPKKVPRGQKILVLNEGPCEAEK